MAQVSIGQVENLEELASGLLSVCEALESSCREQVSVAESKCGEAREVAQNSESMLESATFVFAYIDNWRRCAAPCKDLFGLFELRVAFCMNEDDAGALVSGGIGKFKGIEKPNRAVFVNRMTNESIWFRPYIQEDPQ
jgi:hypothetical protein